MSIPESPSLPTKGCFTLSVTLGRGLCRVLGGYKKCFAIGACIAGDGDPFDIGFTSLDLLVDFCRETAPHSIDVLNADGTRNADLIEKLRHAADGRLSAHAARTTNLHLVN